jgi:signal transduction histidine kinase/DNA-binding response OmpR family regulator
MIPKSKYIIAFVAAVVLTWSQAASAQSVYRFQHFSSKDGLADDFVFSIEQDSLGFMWFQYWGGLTRYDGYNFKIYKRDKDNPRTATLDFGLGRMGLDHRKTLWISKHQFPQRPPFVSAKYDYNTDGFVKYNVNLGNVVIAPARESENVLWLGALFGKGLFSVHDTDSIKNYINKAVSHLDTLARNSIFYIGDMNSNLLLATAKGLWSFDKAKKTFSRPKCNPKDSSVLYNTWFTHMVEKGNQFWGVETTLEYNGAPSAIMKLSPDLSIVDRKELIGYNISCIDFEQNGVAWIGTWNDGLYRYDYKDGSFINIRNIPGDSYSLTTNSINDVCVDRNQNVWIATADGVSKLFRNSIETVEVQGLHGAIGLLKSKKGDFIISAIVTEKFPLNSFELIEVEVPRISGVSTPFNKLRGALNAVALSGGLLQGKRRLWISTYPTGVYYYPLDPETGMVMQVEPTLLVAKGGDSNAIGINGISSMHEDSDENLWIGGQGLHKINTSALYGTDGSVKTYSHNEADTNSISGQTIFHIYAEDEESLWIASNGGLDLFHKTTEVFEHVVKDPGFVSLLLRSSDGTLYAATVQGVYTLSKQSGHYRLSDAPIWSGADLGSIQEDTLGRLWLGTARGIVCYDHKKKLKIPLTESDGIFYKKSINPGSFDKTSDGKMLLVEEGILLFDPFTLSLGQNKPKVVFTSLEVNNEVPWIGKDTGKVFTVKKNISVLQELVVDYQHNNFGVEFSALEMTAPERNLYQHKLDGYDNEWILTDYKNRKATYTNLDPGDYVFKVKASNRHGIWSDFETTLKIKVLPPPWKSPWAYTGYGILFIGLLLAARKNIVNRERLKSNLKLAKVEQEKEHFELEKAKEVDKVKSAFFANISHEFRTPLTLIKGPVQEMMEEFGDHPKVQERMKLVQRNADLVLKLINQLLDLAKLDSGTLTVDKSQNDLNEFLRVVTGSFSSLAFQKNITLETEFPQERLALSFDKGKVETILINLINNAIKFTPAGGSVTVRTELKSLKDETHSAGTPLWRRGDGGEVKEGEVMTLIVSDTGIGIEEDQHEKIFERFHQVSEAHKEGGTGIGLSLVKELVALMKGTLSLKSEPGKGSEFTVILPVEVSQHLATVEEIREFETQRISDELIHALKENGDGLQGTQPRILVVEDNSDLRKFIIDSLGKESQFLEAADGKEGLRTAFDETPDLIISDVMMPEMDGITMTGKLKKDTRTSHIPLILLTAKTSDESKLSGLSTGADDYLTKPFNKQELLLKVRNSIAMQVKLREKIRLELLKESPKVEVQSADEKFLLKVKETILSRLSDEQLSVESLAEEIALSRSQLLRKVTALTGVSVNELIRTFRLQKAAQLLEQNWGPVTQVAYEVGFSNLSYFSKVFKEQYGVLPSEYLAGKIG